MTRNSILKVLMVLTVYENIGAMETGIPSSLDMSCDSELYEPYIPSNNSTSSLARRCMQGADCCCCLCMCSALIPLDIISDITNAEWPEEARQTIVNYCLRTKFGQATYELMTELFGMRESPYID